MNPLTNVCTALTETMAHEIGHLMGLDECDDCDLGSSVMNGVLCDSEGHCNFNDTTNGRVTPSVCDKAMVQQRYATTTPTPTPPPIPSPTPTPSGGGGGGGGEAQPGNRYCSGAYEATDYYYFDGPYAYYAYTEWNYSPTCALNARPDEAQSGENFRPETRAWRVIELDQPEWRHSLPLPALVAQSGVVVVGETIGNVSRRSQNGQVTTDYDVRLLEVLKGNAVSGSRVTVKMPGGWITENDGVILDARTRRVRKMENGKTYMLFLNESDNANFALTPVRGSQGLFELPRNGPRVRHLGRSFDLLPGDDGEIVSVFLQQIRDLTRNR